MGEGRKVGKNEVKEGVSGQGENGVELEKFGDFSEAEWGIGNEVLGRRHASLREA